MKLSKTRAILIAAGAESRWKNYKKINKHFIEIDGEKILHRAVRLLKECGVDDIWVVGKNEKYKIKGAKLLIPKFTKEYHDADKFLSSRQLWNKNGKTLILYGDVYFTEEAIRGIVYNRHHDWLLFARPFGSRLTGKGCGECFAVTFYSNHIRQWEAALHKLVEYYDNKRLGRIGGWEAYRIMAGVPEKEVHIQQIRDRFVEINDWTEDFDHPADYDRFIKRFEQCKKEKLTLNQIGKYRCEECNKSGKLNKNLFFTYKEKSIHNNIKLYYLFCAKCRKRYLDK